MEKHLRNCPECGKELFYTTKKGLKVAINKNSKCKSCSVKQQYLDDTNKNKGNRNGRYEKPLYQLWVDKYGVKEADKRLKNWKRKVSNNNKGENNNMYGKPPPKGSGNGWFGRYKGIYFRSSLELLFLLENNKYDIKNAETNEFKVNYEYNGVKRTYRPDFVIGNVVYEIKPKKLLLDGINQAKIKAAKIHFNNLGYDYQIYDSELSYYQIIRYKLLPIISNNDLYITESTKEKIKKFIIKNKINLEI